MGQDIQTPTEPESPVVDKFAQDLTETMMGAVRASGTSGGTGKRPKPVTKAASQEAEYDAQEFARNPALFGVSVDIVTAALSFYRITRCTLSDAKNYVQKFAGKKV